MAETLQQLARKNSFLKALSQKSAVKIIAGIANTNLNNVLDIVNAATEGNAHAVDVAADTKIVEAVRKATNLFVFASATDAAALINAVTAGADGVEVGNYDALYDHGEFITAESVLSITKQVIAAVKGQALVSVTVPGHLSNDAQNHLAKEIEALGADIIQTEGAVRLLGQTATAPISSEEKAAVTLKNAARLATTVTIPVMAATGINASNVKAALLTGASAVGVGSAVNKLNAADMLNTVDAIMAATKTKQAAVAV